MRPPPARAGASRSTRGQRRPPTRHAAEARMARRPGRRARGSPAHGTSTSSSACGTPPGPPADRRDRRREERDDRRADGGGEVRRAGVADDDARRAGEHAGQLGEASCAPPRSVTPAAAAPATRAVSARSPGPPVTTTSAPAASERRDQRRVALGRPGARGHGGAGVHDDVVARRTTAQRRGGRAAPPSSPGGSGKPGRGGQVERALDLVHVVGDPVADVEQRAGVVDATWRRRAARRPAAAAARSAAGSGGTSRRSPRRPRRGRRRASTSASTSARSTGSGSGSIHGARQTSTSSTPGSSSAARPPRGPHSSVTRSAPCGERADRRAGEQDVAVVVEPDREDVRHAGSGRSAVDRGLEVRARPRRRAAISSRARPRRRHEDPARAGGARRLDVGADVADHHAALRGDAEPRGGVAGSGPAPGLRQRAAVVRARAGTRPTGRAARAAPRPARSPRAPVLASSSPRAMPLWLETTPVRHAGGAQPRERGAPRPGTGSTRVGVAVVGHVVDERPVAVEEDRGRRAGARGAARAAERRPRARAAWPASHQPVAANGHHARWCAAMRRDLGAGARAGRDPRPRRARRCRRARPRPPRPRHARRRRAASAPSAAARRRRSTARWRGRRPRGTPARSRQSRPVQRAHQHVVGVAGLLARARPRRAPGAPGGATLRSPRTIRRPRGGDAQAEVGVLAVGAREALVEAADRARARRAGRRGRRWPSARRSSPACRAPSRSGGGRAGSGTTIRPWTPPTSSAAAGEVGVERRAPVRRRARRRRRGRRPTARSRRASRRCAPRRARAPGRARRGPAPGRATAAAPAGRARSSTRTTSRPPSAARRAAAGQARPPARRDHDVDASCGAPRAGAGRARTRAADDERPDARAGRPAPSRSTRARRAGRRPSAGRRC